ncbi:MAG: hypothetical protein L6Q98_18615 [Anaerolineae bacterium]|nr:hypothetical protein [Anaerolineae bacterium]NUQ03545.1 hypothetical protein [Anaerolineae bacterium]
MFKRYLALLLIAIVLAACEAVNPQPTVTPIPFDRFGVQDVFTTFARAGLPIGGLEQDVTISRDGPRVLKDRWVFEIPRVAPAGGQVIIFADSGQRAEWETYIARLRDDAETRRDVIYTYFHQNIMLQLNTGLTNQEAASYRDALLSLE